jgi:hypothetical protein
MCTLGSNVKLCEPEACTTLPSGLDWQLILPVRIICIAAHSSVLHTLVAVTLI